MKLILFDRLCAVLVDSVIVRFSQNPYWFLYTDTLSSFNLSILTEKLVVDP